jgi:hypothetical protein
MSDHKHHHQNYKPKKHWLTHPALWVPVVLMLLAMVIYVMTLDEALQPGEPMQQEVPAAQ